MLELLKNPVGDIDVFSSYNAERLNKCQKLETDEEKRLTAKLLIKQKPSVTIFSQFKHSIHLFLSMSEYVNISISPCN